jgi:hypothetical protein
MVRVVYDTSVMSRGKDPDSVQDIRPDSDTATVRIGMSLEPLIIDSIKSSLCFTAFSSRTFRFGLDAMADNRVGSKRASRNHSLGNQLLARQLWCKD